VTSHDGFTLADLVSYERKHNEANGEENRDGSDNHLSCNWGVEGPAVDEPTLRLREQLVRSFWATLAFSLGIPMINAGDELGRTQRGNNNAYCQDNEISWLDWTLDDQRRELLAFVQDVLAIRRAHADLQRCAFFRGDLVPGSAVKDVTWLAPDGHEMSGHEWHDGRRQALGMLVHGRLDGGVDARGKALMTQTLLLLLNGGRRACRFQLPSLTAPGRWNLLVHSGVPQVEARRLHGASIRLVPHSLVLLRYEQENP
jgi:glycogen operon protein